MGDKEGCILPASRIKRKLWLVLGLGIKCVFHIADLGYSGPWL